MDEVDLMKEKNTKTHEIEHEKEETDENEDQEDWEGGDTELLLPLGSSSVMVHNEQHSMSMFVMFLQLDTVSLGQACLLELFNHIVRERVITRLKHAVILGYVIGCDIRNYFLVLSSKLQQIDKVSSPLTDCHRRLNGNTGLRIFVESQFPPSTVNAAIEDSLAELEHYLRTLNHADFR